MAEWLAHQITEAFPWATAPRYLIRDNDGAYGHLFTGRVTAMGFRDRPISPGSPWQNGTAERMIGTLRRNYLGHSLSSVKAICAAYSLPLLPITIKRARIGHSRRIFHCGERSSGSVRSQLCQSRVDYIINTSGYDYRKGQDEFLPEQQK